MILLGITGSVAATLGRKLVDDLSTIDQVETILTQSAKNFTNVEHYNDDDEWASWEHGKQVLHIALRDRASVLVIAPCSANTLAKLANGISDNLLTCVARAWGDKWPLIIAPAMNTRMWENPITWEHLRQIDKYYNVTIIRPTTKTLACGEHGIGAMADIGEIIAAINKACEPTWPLNNKWSGVYIPTGDHPGAFGYQRTHDIHTGVDLYVDSNSLDIRYSNENSQVYAIEHGTIINTGPFTGPLAGSNWWKPTNYVMVKSKSGNICYGEVRLGRNLKIGDTVSRGEVIATVLPVLDKSKIRKDIKNHSDHMLHIELYDHSITKPIDVWHHNEPKPVGLLDPTDLLRKAYD